MRPYRRRSFHQQGVCTGFGSISSVRVRFGSWRFNRHFPSWPNIEVPFDNDFKAYPGDRFDSKIKIKMRQDVDFLKAVLAWAVSGCIEWHQHGLEIPKSVQDATDVLFAHNDFLKDFLTECCTREPGKAMPDKASTVSVKFLRNI